MNPPPILNPQEIKDGEHLKLLTIFHYVVGGITILFSSIFILHVVMGISMATHPEMWGGGKAGPPPPVFIGYFMAAFAGAFVLTGWTIGALTIYSGCCIKQRARRMFSLVMAGINCAFFPFGTALGVFTFVVLLRDSVMRIYGTPTGGQAPLPE